MTFWAILVSVFACDQLTKHWVRSHLAIVEYKIIVRGLLSVTHIENRGAAFGLFPGASDLFLAASLIAVLASLFFYPKARQYGIAFSVALGLVSGGTLGNLVDRIGRGTVTDFLSLTFFPPVFNVGDLAIVSGVILLSALLLWRDGPSTLR